ncbi:MAG: hypothetical protein KIS76_16185 [Pyrinomonadaceae bacterium]|nr:hypothetical protein [Pyrinomonadaceae bacterium]
MKELITASLLFFGILSFSCESSSSYKISCEKEVGEIRGLVQKREYSQIYNQASEAFKLATDEENFRNALSGFEDEIGASNSFISSSWTTRIDVREGTLFILAYDCQNCPNIKSDEFMFVREGGEFLLYNYKFIRKAD